MLSSAVVTGSRGSSDTCRRQSKLDWTSIPRTVAVHVSTQPYLPLIVSANLSSIEVTQRGTFVFLHLIKHTRLQYSKSSILT